MTDAYGGASNRGNRTKRDQPSRPITSRVPPHNLSAEESLLGAMLLSREAVNAASEAGIRVEHFYKPGHQHVFDAMRALLTGGEPVDPVTVADELRRVGLLEEIGGLDFLLQLQNSTPVIGNALRYAKIVMDTAALRRLIGVASEIAEIAYTEPDDVAKALDDAESRVFAVAEERVIDSTRPINELLVLAWEEVEKRYQSKVALTGVPTGFVDLDELILGLQPSSLVIVGARPGMGKTAFAMNVASNVAQATNLPVLVFSLEMSHTELTMRFLSSEARIDSKKLRTGAISEAEWSRINTAIGRLEDRPLYLDDNASVTVMEIRAKARRLKAKHGGLGLIVIDYLQLMSGNNGESRQLEVSEISRNLKILARELEVPVVALSQLSRRLEDRQDKRPQLSDLRESGSLEQDADIVIFLHRPELFRNDRGDAAENSEKGVAEVIVGKHRAGPTDTVRLVFFGEHTRFENMARGFQADPDSTSR
ncbi:MAG: replicative DNA helicase [Actinomycetota bacterium]